MTAEDGISVMTFVKSMSIGLFWVFAMVVDSVVTEGTHFLGTGSYWACEWMVNSSCTGMSSNGWRDHIGISGIVCPMSCMDGCRRLVIALGAVA